MKLKNILIVGATGMIGGLILKKALQNENVEKVISISRKVSGIRDIKLIEIIHDNYLDYTQVESNFSDITIAFFCIGVYTGLVSREKFREITVDYAKAFADTLKKNSSDASLVFLSGMGADRSEKSKMIFAIDKGIAENYLLSKGFKNLYIFRPGYIYPVVPRIEPNILYKIYRFLYPILNILLPSTSITSEQLAGAMLAVGINGCDHVTLENKDILAVDTWVKN